MLTPIRRPTLKHDCAQTKARVQKGLHRPMVKRVDGEKRRQKVELSTAQGYEARPPNLCRPAWHDQHPGWPLRGELANDIWEESPRRVQPNDLLPSIERESI